MSNIDNIKQILTQYKQEHLIKFYNELTAEEKANLEEQILNIDFEQINKLFEQTKIDNKNINDKIEPMKYVDKYKLTLEEKNSLEKIGENSIRKGEYAVATMAGGQGTRLRAHRTKRNFCASKWKITF